MVKCRNSRRKGTSGIADVAAVAALLGYNAHEWREREGECTKERKGEEEKKKYRGQSVVRIR